MPQPLPPRAHAVETFHLGSFVLPRLFTGLWQLSSNSWGSAPAAKVRRQMEKYAENGYTAFADHYGPAEILFGEFRGRRPHPDRVFGATKWCVFRQIEPTRKLVDAAVQDRLTRMQAQRIDMLQFHWQNYSDTGYFTALRHLQDIQREGKIGLIGLCNFDSQRTDEICQVLGPGSIVSNQVQFSLVDIRPLFRMAAVCNKHDVKLLTYGTMCGGFLSDTWLGKEEPDLYSGALTPSQRKYLDMIVKAWGSWALFQDLLVVLRSIANKYEGMSIANIAIRWVLDHPFVGAVIIGARMGVSEHTDDNQKVYGFRLSADDREAIQAVLLQSNGAQLIDTIGDCGAEYR
ncbi:Aldo/keto reductase [Lenzites betulinus]|nr:Aldo/keto reductase [Lenzites betulinus]